MLADAADLASGQEIQTDVCIVGAGPAGISIAHELRGTDIRVWLLESGGRDVERRAQRLNRGQSVGYSIHRLHRSRVRAFGGTSRHWFSPSDDSWAARPLDPIDFEVRPGIRYFDRPFEGAHLHLDPCYEHAHEVCRLGPFVYGPLTRPTRGLAPRPTATPRRRCDHAAPCGAPRLQGFCCASAECDPAASRACVDLATHEDPDRVDRVQVRRADGSSCFVRAQLIVLAAGGIENQRMLRHRACRSGNARSCPPNRRWPPRWSPCGPGRDPAACVAADEVYARTRACAIRCANTLARCCGRRRIDVSPNRGVRPTPPGWEAKGRASTRRHGSRCRPKPSTDTGQHHRLIRPNDAAGEVAYLRCTARSPCRRQRSSAWPDSGGT